MSRSAWLIASAALFSIACAGADADERTEETNAPVEPDDTRDTDGDGQPGTFVSEGADGLRLEMSGGSSYRCTNICASVCSDCLFEACMAAGGDTSLCVRSRDDCFNSCGVCEGGSATACYSPCWKGQRSCYENLAVVMPDEVTRPEVTRPGVMPDDGQSTPDDTQPSSGNSTPSSSSSGNNGRPAN